MERIKKSSLFPLVLVLVWTFLLALGIWRHAHETVQLPIYDAFLILREGARRLGRD